MMFSDTIFAIITAEGSVVHKMRVSGSKVKKILPKLGVNDNLNHKQVYLKNISINNKIIDQVLLFVFYGPNSFTGEDILEIDFHGSSYIKDTLVQKMLSIESVRYAKNGEFMKRALLNNKINLNQAQSINDLIASKTKIQHSKSIENYSSVNQNNLFNQIKDDITSIMCILESNMDFSESDDNDGLINKTLLQMQKTSSEMKDKIQKSLNQYENNRKIISGIKIAIVGDVNVGKSTLINTISNEEISIVSHIKGTTRDSVSINIDFFGYYVTFIDTAGFRKTKDTIELKGIEKSKKKIETSDIVINVLNYNKNLNIDKIVSEKEDNEIIVINKIDKVDKKIYLDIKNKYKDILFTSLIDKIGIDALYSQIKDKIETSFLNDDNNLVSTFEKDILRKILNEIESINWSEPFEIIYENFRSISHLSNSLSIKIDNEEILDNIFSKFCIGK